MRGEPGVVRVLERQKIVAVGRAGGLLDHLEDPFAESAVEVQRFENPEHALALLDAFEIDLILVEHPLGEHTIREFVVEASSKLGGKDQKILVLARPEALSEMIATVGDRFPVLGGDEPKLLRERVAPHLKRFPKRAKRLMVTIQVRIGGVGLHRMAQTENLSETGALIRTRERVPVGSEIDLELHLPGGVAPIGAFGEVVRYLEPEGDRAGGLGVAFTRLAGDAAERLNADLDSCLAETPA